MIFVGMLSGGIDSYLACKRVRDHGDLVLLFADTLAEDQGCYRFLIESAAALQGVAVSPRLLRLADDLPEIEHPDRKKRLRELASVAMNTVPHFYWLADGRGIWEVFEDSNFIGNSRVAPCSHKLKQRVCRSWVEIHCDIESSVLVLGIDSEERHRFFGRYNEGGGAKDAWLPYTAIAPLCDSPILSHSDKVHTVIADGLTLPRLYTLGFVHNNCGGFCVRAGHGNFKQLLEHFPSRYAYHECNEERLRSQFGKDVAILNDRRGGKVTPLPLVTFRERITQDGSWDSYNFGGCGCFSEPG